MRSWDWEQCSKVLLDRLVYPVLPQSPDDTLPHSYDTTLDTGRSEGGWQREREQQKKWIAARCMPRVLSSSAGQFIAAARTFAES